ncbi:DUF2922 domain-containing protein [Pseudalkalibacillus caeni]|uniref:DUF2922 domain-containing protein n=1 Tax=Exobacillus caeni TaxID=2574798 RepID=A0A5R9F989_9BACL|nr:DUF2922 domain-containing protein [Pseudalkalibacillus caeni]TLS38188.1 DUF2922 domain-containing protein [Pseudalkalibacillus caeni]
MAKTLELQFITQDNKTTSLSLNDPIDPIDPAAVAAAMDVVVAQNIFSTSGGDIVGKKGARLIERNVSDIEIL